MVKGVKISIDKVHSVWLCIISSFSDELKDLIRKRLSSICHGSAMIKSCGQYSNYTYTRTLSEFLSRYQKKTPEIKKGMIGELLSHLLLTHCDNTMEAASPYFNLEEEGVKKGFDLVIRSTISKDLWFTEVKSGEAKERASIDKTCSLIHTAKVDMKTKLNSKRYGLWHNAIHGAMMVYENSAEIKGAVRGVLEAKLDEVHINKQSSTSANVILISVLYSRIDDSLQIEHIRKLQRNIMRENIFSGLIVFSIQKQTYKRIEDFLIAEAVNANN